MDISSAQKPSHKKWRQKVKKERRRRLRRKAAQDRDAESERLKLALEKNADYLNLMKENEAKEKEEEILEEEERIKKENEWLEKELKAQEEWRALQERREKARQAQLEQEEMIRKEYETKQEAIRKKVEEEKRRIEKELKKQEDIQNKINDYIDNGAKTPEFMRFITETQPGKSEICQFFTKTGSCRYGDVCSRNHQKVGLSKVILVPGFYSHYSLEVSPGDCDFDSHLEYDSAELKQHFEEFYRDVVPELESFGKIKTLKFCRNCEPHLRGNLYVEYYTEREAARAVRKLKGRWFARRQIHCEFAGIKSWRTAICGMSRCPKGRFCNFLHVFRNPNNEYYVRSPPRWAKKTDDSSRRSESHRHKVNWEDSTRGEVEQTSRNWRWDSPDPEPDERKRGRGYPDDRYQSSKRSNYASSSRSRNYNDNRFGRDYEDMSDEEYYSKHRNSNSRSRRYNDEYRNGNGDSRHRRSDGKYSSRSHRSKRDRSRHRKKSHERDRSKEHRRSKRKLKHSRDSDPDEEEFSKNKKSNTDKNVESKWDENTSVKEKANSSNDSSSSPASTSGSSDSSEKEEESKIESLQTEPEPKRQKISIPEYYEWDTTESEDDEKK